MAKKVSVKKYTGVYFTESQKKRWRDRPDRCYWIAFRDSQEGILRWERCGWASEGWTPEAAQRRRYELLEKDRAGKYKPKQQRKAEKLTFGELAEKYIEWSKTNKKSSRDDIYRYTKYLAPVFGNKQLKNIVPFQIERFKKDLFDRGLSPASVKHCLGLIRQIFNKGILWGMYDGTNSVKQVKLPYLNNRRLRFLSHEEANVLLEELSDCSPLAHDQALLSLHCGLRFGEIANLIRADLDFTHDIIQIRDPKGASRQAFMTPQIKEILSRRVTKEMQPTDLIFPSRKGTKQVTVTKAFDRAVMRLGFNNGVSDRRDKMVFHTLRHTFASWLAIQGESLFTIMELMGHKTIEMTMRYAHLMPDQKKEAVLKLSNQFINKRQSHLKMGKEGA